VVAFQGVRMRTNDASQVCEIKIKSVKAFRQNFKIRELP